MKEESGAGWEGHEGERLQSGDRTNVSAFVCANAAGSVVPPFFIIPGDSVMPQFTVGAPADAVFGSSNDCQLHL